MTEIKKFKRGNRTYTRMGAYKEVRIDTDAPQQAPPGASGPAPSVQVDVESTVESGLYSNAAFVHKSSDEIVLDFAFMQPHVSRARILSRVILAPQQARKIAKLLQEACNDKK